MDPKSEGEIWLSLRFLGLAGIADEIFMTLNLFRNAKPGVQSQPIYIQKVSSGTNFYEFELRHWITFCRFKLEPLIQRKALNQI